MRLLLIRHGETPSNVAGALDTGFPGPGLTEKGHRQARAVPGALAQARIDGLYASPLVRTQLTADPLATQRDDAPQVLDGLEEIQAGDLEMRTDIDALRSYHASTTEWIRGDLSARMPGAESGHEFMERYGSAVRRIAEAHGSDGTAAVFSHGSAIRLFTAIATGLDERRAGAMRLDNTGASLLEGDPDEGWRLVRWVMTPLGESDIQADLAG
ncbi:histidine phosphatase family protein [Microbacterium sp. gxy059]|uniref:histidine phosphatase family protein n=1 Tax=Microbacterium sp. gxy059 TaxID=2957199 RepID=UPI003D9611D1